MSYSIEWTRTPQSRSIYAFGREVHPFPGPGSGPPTYKNVYISFKVGRTYVYDVGDQDIYTQMKNAPSKGRFYVFAIKARWDYIRRF